jgi:hypothetical protein
MTLCSKLSAKVSASPPLTFANNDTIGTKPHCRAEQAVHSNFIAGEHLDLVVRRTLNFRRVLDDDDTVFRMNEADFLNECVRKAWSCPILCHQRS